MGQTIVTTDAITDPHKLSIKLRLNGQTMQDSNTDQLIFGVPALIEFLSQTITLEPGDVIATGTPPGVGFARKPPVFLKPGDEMEVLIEGIGGLGNPVVSDGIRVTQRCKVAEFFSPVREKNLSGNRTMRKLFCFARRTQFVSRLHQARVIQQPNAKKKLTIAVIPKGTTHEFWKSIHAGSIKAAQELTAAGH